MLKNNSMLLKFNEKKQSLEFLDDMKGRLKASRMLSILIFVVGGIKLALIDWTNLSEYDFMFIFLEIVFAYLVYSNFLVKVSDAEIKVKDIKYFKPARGMKSKAVFKLKNGKVREVYNLSSKPNRERIKKEVLKAGVVIK